MSVAHAERPHFLADLEGVDERLHLQLPDRVHAGEIGEVSGDPARLARFVDAPVVLGVRTPESFSARLLVRSAVGQADINAFADMAMREVGNQRAVVLRCIASALTLSLITILDPAKPIENPSDVPPPVLHWSLLAVAAMPRLVLTCWTSFASSMREDNCRSSTRIGRSPSAFWTRLEPRSTPTLLVT